MRLRPNCPPLGTSVDRRALVFFAIAACGTLLTSRRALADLTPYHLNDVQYDWPSPFPTGEDGDDFALTTTFTVWEEPGDNTYFYLSHFFSLGPYGDSTSRVGYFGVQTTGGTGRALIFSVWGGTSATGPGCTTFEEGGSGYHCVVDYPWAAKRPYTLVLSRSSAAQEEIFSATVTDVLAKKTSSLGQIRAPRGGKMPSQSIFFYEYYGNLTSCQALPYMPMTFSDIAANGGRVVPVYNAKAYGYESACAANIITKVCNNTIDNEAGGAVARPAEQTHFQEGKDCRVPPTSAVPGVPTPGPTPSPAPSPAPSPSGPDADGQGNSGGFPDEANDTAPVASPPASIGSAGGTAAGDTDGARGTTAFLGQGLRPAGCAASAASGCAWLGTLSASAFAACLRYLEKRRRKV